MDIVKWNRDSLDPFRELNRIQDEINRIFNFPRIQETEGIFDRAFSPAIDVVENADNYTVRCDLPGVDQKNLRVSVEGDVLTIKGEKKYEKKEKDKDARYYRNELWEGSFQRTLSLPAGVDANKVDAELKDGVLTVTLPKKEEHKPRQITVKSV